VIRGQIGANGEPRSNLKIRDASGHTFQFNAVVDTGFNGAISLPPSLLQSLGFTSDAEGTAFLVDGTSISYDIYPVELEWDGIGQRMSIWALGDEPLVGCDLLRGYELRVEFAAPGAVDIQKL
jgi:clan AA aspartic protease